MTDIMELRAKRANLWEAAKAFLDTHTGKDGKLSLEDSAAYDRMEADVVALGKDIERLERQAAIDKELAQPATAPITNAPGGKEGVDTDGGYLVPEEMDSRLVDVLTEENVMRTLGTTLTTSGERKINIAATKPAASWIEEGGALSFGDATFDQIILDAHKLHVAIKVTEELLYDNAFNLESYIIEQFGKAIANAEEDAFLNGDGAAKPKGLFQMADTGVTTSGASIASDDLISLIYSLKRPYRRNASFLVNDQTLAVIRKLKDNNNAYLWQRWANPTALWVTPSTPRRTFRPSRRARRCSRSAITATTTSATAARARCRSSKSSSRATAWSATS